MTGKGLCDKAVPGHRTPKETRVWIAMQFLARRKTKDPFHGIVRNIDHKLLVPLSDRLLFEYRLKNISLVLVTSY